MIILLYGRLYIMNIIDVKILDKRLGKKFSFLKYSTPGSSGLDLNAMLIEKCVIHSHEVVLIPTGISIFIKDPLITAIILPRSGLGHRNGIILGNSVGLVDSDYQGEIMMSIWNRSKKDFIIFPGDRIAQLVFVPIIKPKFNIVLEFKKISYRQKYGFGHSGI